MAAGTYIFLDHTPLHAALEKVEGLDPSPIIHGGLASLVLVGMALAVNRSFKGKRLLPEERTFSLTNLMELAVSGLLAFMEDLMGEDAKRFLPLIGGTAFFILFNNLLGSIPGFDSSTANLNTTLACALVIFIATHFIGVRAHGVKYIKHFLGPVWWLAPLMLPIELISHFARILSLSIRLLET